MFLGLIQKTVPKLFGDIKTDVKVENALHQVNMEAEKGPLEDCHPSLQEPLGELPCSNAHRLTLFQN